MNKYIAAIDQGTTSTRCMIFDHGGQVVAADQREHAQLFAQPGWVEHDAPEIWERTQQVVAGALAKSGIARAQLAAVGITNQRETTLLWDRHTGQPVHHAIVWQDTRTAAICARLARTGGQNRFRRKTGLPLATYFSGPKIKWLLDNVPHCPVWRILKCQIHMSLQSADLGFSGLQGLMKAIFHKIAFFIQRTFLH